MKIASLLNKNTAYFRQLLMKWHTLHNRRSMPWKGIRDVYKIWLSEVILQQTRVEQGTDYYHRFIENYPTVLDLARADETKVLKLWEGLGYYSRCKNLHATAKYIAFERNGEFPKTCEELMQLKGVGPYTAAAIASFAYDLPHAVIDGNVIRVMARFFGISSPADSNQGKKLFNQLAQAALDKNQPAKYNQAIMDFGATVCKPANPNCESCLLQKKCFAYQNNAANRLPVFEKKIKKKTRWLIYLILRQKNSIALQQREKGDIWAGLYDFPSVECGTKTDWEKRTNQQNVWKIPGIDPKYLHKSSAIMPVEKIYVQQLTHQKIYAKIIRIELKKKQDYSLPVHWQNIDELTQMPYPKLIRDIINDLD